MKTAIAFSLLLLCTAAVFAGQPPKPAPASGPAPSAPVISDQVIYPFPVEEHAKFRDMQFEWDQLEIENGKLLLQVAENKQKQAEMKKAMQKFAYDFGVARKINLDLFDLSPHDLKFVPRKDK